MYIDIQMVDIYVSRPGLACEDIVNLMHINGISGAVTRNYSSVPQRTGTSIEEGCRVRIHEKAHDRKHLKKVWNMMQTEFGFKCAYIDASPRFQGCVFDYIRPSACEGPD